MRPRSFCDTRSIRSNCFPGAGLIRSHRCKRRRCTDGGCRRPCPPCRSLALWRRKRRIRPGGAATSACPPLRHPPPGATTVSRMGSRESGRPVPVPPGTPALLFPLTSHQDRGGKAALFPRKTVCIPPDGHPLSSARRACLTSFPHSQSSPACTGDNQGPNRQNCGGKVRPLGDRAGARRAEARHTKKTPSR